MEPTPAPLTPPPFAEIIGETKPEPFRDVTEPPPSKDEAAGERARDAAWRAPSEHWHGAKLAALAIDREGDWLAHRESIGCSHLSKCIGNPPLFMADSLRIVWFCAHDPAEWLDAPPSTTRSMDLEKRIRAWGVESVGPGEQADLVALAYRIYDAAYSTHATAKTTGSESGN